MDVGGKERKVSFVQLPLLFLPSPLSFLFTLTTTPENKRLSSQTIPYLPSHTPQHQLRLWAPLPPLFFLSLLASQLNSVRLSISPSLPSLPLSLPPSQFLSSPSFSARQACFLLLSPYEPPFPNSQGERGRQPLTADSSGSTRAQHLPADRIFSSLPRANLAHPLQGQKPP